MATFFAEDTYDGKLRAAFSYPSRAPPGTRHIYHTTDHMILVRAAAAGA
jgi:hypothetical protein